MPRDYYEVLGVSRDADDATIKKAFRRLARELHPDVNRQRPRGRGEVQGGRRGLRGAVGPRAPGHLRPLRPRGPAQRRLGAQLRGVRLGVGHLRGVLRRRRRVRRPVRRGRRPPGGAVQGGDVAVAAEIDLADAPSGDDGRGRLRGRDRVRALPRQRRRAGHADRDLPALPGAAASCAPSRARRSARSCAPPCATPATATGEWPASRARCVAAAAARSSATKVSVDIPAGIADGQRIRITGPRPRRRARRAARRPVRAGPRPRGLAVRARRRRPRDRRRRGRAAGGARHDASRCRRSTGETELEIPAGTQPHETLLIRGAGMPSLRGRRTGDLRVVVNVVDPAPPEPGAARAARAAVAVDDRPQPPHRRGRVREAQARVRRPVVH